MEKEFVPYELAVKLKSLGFDEPCFSTYNSDKKVSRNPSHNMEDLPIEGQPYYWQNSKIHVSCITAPTFSQAFRWFREKYPDLDFGVAKIHNGTNNYHYHIKLQWEFFEGSYEEAELACLDKLIELTFKSE